jgi:hypothetical protein
VGVVLSPEQERAAIVAYTGLWQLRELDPAAETPARRAARLELRDQIDANAEDGGDARPLARLMRLPLRGGSPRPKGRKRKRP